jgi:hypothetical protein
MVRQSDVKGAYSRVGDPNVKRYVTLPLLVPSFRE